jgi:hypothetical protein
MMGGGGALALDPGGLRVLLGLGLLAFLLVVEVAAEAGALDRWLRGGPRWQRWSAFAGMAGLFVLLADFGGADFIYFQF